jgi:hypothetical protein
MEFASRYKIIKMIEISIEIFSDFSIFFIGENENCSHLG